MKIKRLVLLALFTVLTCSITPLLQAQALTEGTVINGAEVAIGENSKADGENAIAIGDTAVVNSYTWLNPIYDAENDYYTYSPTLLSSANSIAYGSSSYVIGENSVAIGVNSSINKIDSSYLWNTPTGNIAIGDGTSVNTYTNAINVPDDNGGTTSENVTVGSSNSVVIGTNSSVTNDNSIVIGSNNSSIGEKSIIIGTDAYIEDINAGVSKNIILGTDAYIKTRSSAKVNNTIVFGNGAHVSPGDSALYRGNSTVSDSIVFGPDSIAANLPAGANNTAVDSLVSRSIAFGIGAEVATGGDSTSLIDSIAFGSNVKIYSQRYQVDSDVLNTIAFGSNVLIDPYGSPITDSQAFGSNILLKNPRASYSSINNIHFLGSNINYETTVASYVTAIGSDFTFEGSLNHVNFIGSDISHLATNNGRLYNVSSVGFGNTFSSKTLKNSSGDIVDTVVIGNNNTLTQSKLSTISDTIVLGSGSSISVESITRNRTDYSGYVSRSIVIGKDADITTRGAGITGSIVIGSGANINALFASGGAGDIDGSIAIGNDSTISASNSISLGASANATSANSIALGLNSKADASSAIAIGPRASSNALQSVAIGGNSIANDTYTISIGRAAYTDDVSGISYDQITRRLVNLAAGIDDTDGVNVSQLKKHGTDVASALGGTSSYSFNSSDGTGTLATGLEVGGTTYTSVQDALNAIDGGTGGGSTLSVNYDDESKETVTLGNTSGATTVTNVKAGELSETSTDAVNGSQLYETNQNLASLNGLAVKYDDESKTSITLGNGADKVSIKNVADGVDANDAVNKGQLDAGIADAKASGKWNLKVNDSAAEEISGGKVVTLKDGTNVAITKDADGNYVFSTVAAPEFDSVTIRNTNISINSDGIDMGDKKIINLQRGDVSEGSSDAVTGGQLYETNQTIQQLDASSVKYDANSGKTKITLEGTGGTTITNVKAGELSETSTDAVNGSQLYETNQNLASLNGLAVKYKEGSTNRLELNDGDNGTVRISNVATPENDTDAANKKYVDDKTSDISEDLEGLSGSVVKYDEGSDKTKITLEGTGGTTITNVKAGELSETSTDAVNGSQLYATNERVGDLETNVGDITTNLSKLDRLAVKYDDESKTSISLGNGTDKVTIKNVADGVDANDAVNKGQLDKGLEDTLASANAKSKWSLKVNDGEAEEIGDGKVVTLKDGTNVAITKDADGNYVFSTVAAPEFDAISIRNTNISISSTGINMGGLKITNLQRGDVSEGSTDAVTGGQLHETNQRIDEIETNVGSLSNSAVKYDDETKSSVTLEGTDGTRIGNVADGVDAKDAVNKGQLDSVKSELEGQISENVTNINNKIENIEGDITNLDDRVTKLEDLDYLGDAAVTYDGNDKSSVTLKGENGTKISNLADGTEESDAVNFGQLSEVKGLSEANAEKLEEHSVYIENHEQEFKTLQTVLGDGYSNPTFNTIKIGDISSDGININMGGGIITGLGDGGIYPGSTDAVTGNQLWNAYKRMDDLQESINIVGAHAAAMSGLHPVPYNPYEPTTLSAAFGTYRDEYAVAVGVFHYVRSNLMFNLGASLCSDGDIMGRAGISIAVGPNSKKKPELARDMVSMQQQQIQSQYRIQELEAEIAALKQQITQITNISK